MLEYRVYTLEGKEYAVFFASDDETALIYFVENFDDFNFKLVKVEVEEE